MVVAQDQHGQLKVIDRIRDMVRLGAGFQENGELSTESQESAIECLQRFGQRRDRTAAYPAARRPRAAQSGRRQCGPGRSR